MWPATAFSVARGSIQQKSSSLKFPRAYHSKCSCSGYLKPRLAFIYTGAAFLNLRSRSSFWVRNDFNVMICLTCRACLNT